VSWAAALAAGLTLTPAAALASRERPIPSQTGTDIRGEVIESRAGMRLYLFQIPEDAVQVDVTLQNAEGDVDLLAVCGDAVPESDEDWSWGARGAGERTSLSLTRHAESDLRAGPFLIEVRPDDPAGHHGEHRSLPFTLRVDTVRLSPPRVITPGSSIEDATAPEAGHRRDFAFDVPARATALRIDLVSAERDIDLLLSSQSPPLDRDTAQWSAATALSRESLVLDAGAVERHCAGRRLYLSVVDPSLYDAPVHFRVAVTLAEDPPAEALEIPELPRPSDPRERALAAVVEILTGEESGSGTLVRDDGLILTARHVIGDRTGESGEIAVAMDLDPTGVTHDLFHAKVVRSDAGLDVALLRITSGLYGQPLPKGYRFPACPVAFDGLPRLGDEIVTIGFPEPAGVGTRAPVMYSKGVVAGFEREKSGLRLKTDAFVATGSSGGAALDRSFRLVGVPVFTMSDSSRAATLGFLVPVMGLPSEWREMIQAAPR
jgi:S1-C subfamily serine protease